MSTRRVRDAVAELLGVVREAVEAELEGEPPVSPADLEGLGSDATAELPEAFRDAFAAAALLGDGAEVPGWGEAREELGGAVGRFLRGRRCAVAVTGAVGPARDALLRYAEGIAMARASEEEHLLVSRVAIPAICATEGELIAQLAQALGVEEVDTAAELAPVLAAGPRRIVLIERAHNLYMRKIGGFEALRAGLELIGATFDRVLWVADFDLSAWSYLDQLFQLHAYFDVTVAAPPLDGAGLRTLFLRQAATLGAAELKLLPLHGLSEPDRARWGEVLYWDRLAGACQGNPEAASQLFCHAARWSQELGKAWVLPPRVYPFKRALASFSKPALLALAMILEHDALSREQLAELMLLAPGEAQALLDGLERFSALVRLPAGVRYAINAPWLAAIRDHLTECNVL